MINLHKKQKVMQFLEQLVRKGYVLAVASFKYVIGPILKKSVDHTL